MPRSGEPLEHRQRLLGGAAQVRHPQHDIAAGLGRLHEQDRDPVHDLLHPGHAALSIAKTARRRARGLWNRWAQQGSNL